MESKETIIIVTEKQMTSSVVSISPPFSTSSITPTTSSPSSNAISIPPSSPFASSSLRSPLSVSSLSSAPSPNNPGKKEAKSPLAQLATATSFTRSSFIIPSSSFSPAPSSSAAPPSYLLHHFLEEWNPLSPSSSSALPLVDTEIGEMGSYGLSVSVLLSRFEVNFSSSPPPPPPAELSAPVEPSLPTPSPSPSLAKTNNIVSRSTTSPSPSRATGKKKKRRKVINQKTWDYEREKEKYQDQQERSLKEILERKVVSRKNRLTRSNSMDLIDPRISGRLDPSLLEQSFTSSSSFSPSHLKVETEEIPFDSGSESDDEGGSGGRCGKGRWFMFKGMRGSRGKAEEEEEELNLNHQHLVNVSKNHRLFRDDYYGDFGTLSPPTPSRVTATNILFPLSSYSSTSTSSASSASSVPSRPQLNEAFSSFSLSSQASPSSSSPAPSHYPTGLMSSPAELENSLWKKTEEEERIFLRKKEEMRRKMIDHVRRVNDLSAVKKALPVLPRSSPSEVEQPQSDKVLTLVFMRKKKQFSKYRHLLLHVSPFIASSFKHSPSSSASSSPAIALASSHFGSAPFVLASPSPPSSSPFTSPSFSSSLPSTSSSPTCHWSSVSIEVQLRIVKRLDLSSLIFLSRTCKYFQELISKCDQLWFLFTKRYFSKCPRSLRMTDYEDLETKWRERYLLCVKEHLPDSSSNSTVSSASFPSNSSSKLSSEPTPSLLQLTPCSCHFYLEQKARHLTCFSSSSKSSFASISSSLPYLSNISSSSPQLRQQVQEEAGTEGRETRSLNSIRDSVMEDSILFPPSRLPFASTGSSSNSDSDGVGGSKWKRGFLPRKWVSFRDN